ncbi:hypothetical protein D3C72_2489960 [compost metagenome]
MIRTRVGDIPLERLVALSELRRVKTVFYKYGAVIAKRLSLGLGGEHDRSPSFLVMDAGRRDGRTITGNSN